MYSIMSFARRHVFLCLGVGVLLVGSIPGFADGYRLYLEPEECHGLERYPYHNEDSAGWYARDAMCRGYGAPGKTCCAAIHSNSAVEARTMSMKLDEPVPAGKYRVFLRTVGPRDAEKDTVVQVGIGSAKADFKWKKGSKKFKWLPGVNVELKNDAREVTFKAVQFGGRGHGGLYEPLFETIWIDTLYITDDLDEKKPPDQQAEWLIRSGLVPADETPRPEYASDEFGYDNPRTPCSGLVDAPTPILLKSFDGRVNMWPNSSFELGMNDGWSDRSQQKHVLTDNDLDDTSAFEGRFSLKLFPAQELFHRPYCLEAPGEYVLSLWAKGIEKGALSCKLMKALGPGDPGYAPVRTKAEPVAEISLGLGKDWTRTVKNLSLEPGWYYLQLTSDVEARIDAVQFEPGSSVTDYAPRAVLEGAIRSGRLANIIYQEEQDTLDVCFHNSGDAELDAQLAYTVRDVRDRVVAKGVTPVVKVKPGESVRKPVEILPELRGTFSLLCSVKDRLLPESELVYVLMPQPADKNARHNIGGHMSYGPDELAVNSRLGVRWIANTKIRSGFEAEQLHPEPDVWNWTPGEDINRADDLMMDEWISFWPRCSPDFMMTEPQQQQRTFRGVAVRELPEMKTWKDYVRKVVSHYRDNYRIWGFEDDAVQQWAPSICAEYMKQTHSVIDSVSPDIMFGTFRSPEYMEAILKTLPPDTMEFFGSDSITYQYWPSKHAGHLAKRHGKYYAGNGVGGHSGTHTMYHSLYRYRPAWPKAALMARCLVYTMLVQDVKLINNYTAQLGVSFAHDSDQKSLFDYDGTPLPWGATFGCLGALLANAEPVGDIPLGKTDRRVFLFRNKDKTGAALFSTAVRRSDMHFRPADRIVENVTLSCPENSVEVLDMYWNPLPGVKWDNGKLNLELNEEPMFIVDRALGDSEFRKTIATAETAPEPCEMSFEFVPGTDCPVALKVTVRNNTPEDMTGLTIDFRFAGGRYPLSMAGTWLLKRRVANIDSVPAGGNRSILLPTNLDGVRCLEDCVLRANITTAEGREWAADADLWYVPAYRTDVPHKPDGDLSDWKKGDRGWLFYEWAWAPMGRHVCQLAEGGEMFSYPPYFVDARAAFRVSWDDDNLYLAITLEDDEPILDKRGEEVRVSINPAGRPHDIGISFSDGKTVTVLLDGKPVPAAMSTEVVEMFQGGIVNREPVNVVNVEIAVPLERLGVDPNTPTSTGFDLVWTDADHENGKLVRGKLRWAGQAAGTGWMQFTANR